MTKLEFQILDFINSSQNKSRRLDEFDYIINIEHNKGFKWMIIGSRLGKLCKKGWIYKSWQIYTRHNIIVKMTPSGVINYQKYKETKNNK